MSHLGIAHANKKHKSLKTVSHAPSVTSAPEKVPLPRASRTRSAKSGVPGATPSTPAPAFVAPTVPATCVPAGRNREQLFGGSDGLVSWAEVQRRQGAVAGGRGGSASLQPLHPYYKQYKPAPCSLAPTVTVGVLPRVADPGHAPHNVQVGVALINAWQQAGAVSFRGVEQVMNLCTGSWLIQAAGA